MIDNEILDQVIPVPDLMELKDRKIQELADEGFSITNFHSGGVFYTLMLILLRIQIELLNLGRTILNQMFVSHATGVWLDLKMADYSKSRKQAQKAQGTVTVSRAEKDGEAVKIPKGHIFKTTKDINGDELRFVAMEETTLQKGAASVEVPVEAEAEGSRYNVPAAQITRTLTYLGEVTITNGKNWLTREGSDTEDDESARERTLRSWSELALVRCGILISTYARPSPGCCMSQSRTSTPEARARWISSSPRRPGQQPGSCWSCAGPPVRRSGSRTQTFRSRARRLSPRTSRPR